MSDKINDSVLLYSSYCGDTPEELLKKITEEKEQVLKKHPSASDWRCELSLDYTPYEGDEHAAFHLNFKRDLTPKELKQKEKEEADRKKWQEQEDARKYKELKKKFEGKKK